MVGELAALISKIGPVWVLQLWLRDVLVKKCREKGDCLDLKVKWPFKMNCPSKAPAVSRLLGESVLRTPGCAVSTGSLRVTSQGSVISTGKMLLQCND